MSAQTLTDPPCPSVFTLFDTHSKVKGSVTAFIRVSGSFAIYLALTLMRKNRAHVAETQTRSYFQCDLFCTVISVPGHKNKCRNIQSSLFSLVSTCVTNPIKNDWYTETSTFFSLLLLLRQGGLLVRLTIGVNIRLYCPSGNKEGWGRCNTAAFSCASRSDAAVLCYTLEWFAAAA